MGGGKRSAKGRLDKFYHLAKEHGYRSRAAFKLVQLNKKFNFLKDCEVLIDLCAAPGSWCQVASKNMSAGKVIIGVDLDPIKPIPNVTTFVGDITTLPCRHELQKLMKNKSADVVLHDGSPNMGTAWSKDSYTQAELVLYSCRLATEFLKPNGAFITKVFRSSEYNKVLWVLNQLFIRVTATKPQASRSVSAEIFVVCEGFLAPKKIDPRLLDPKHVLPNVKNPLDDKVSILKKQKKRPNCYGYQEGQTLIFKKAPVSEFLFSNDPVKVLSIYNELHFENAEDSKYLTSEWTNDDVKAYLSDLKVLGKSEFMKLIQWRSRIRAQVSEERKSSQEHHEDQPVPRENEEADFLKTIDEIAIEEIRKSRRKSHKIKKIRERRRRRIISALEEPENYYDNDLFNLKKVKGKISTNAPANYLLEESSDSQDVFSESDENKESKEDGCEDYMSDDEFEKRKIELLDDQLDIAYRNYVLKKVSNKKKSIKTLKEMAKRDLNLDEDKKEKMERALEYGEDNLVDENQVALEFSEQEEKGEETQYDPRELVLQDIGKKERSELWFNQDLFQGVNDQEEIDEKLELEKRIKMLPSKKMRSKNDNLNSEIPKKSSSRVEKDNKLMEIDNEVSDVVSSEESCNETHAKSLEKNKSKSLIEQNEESFSENDDTKKGNNNDSDDSVSSSCNDSDCDDIHSIESDDEDGYNSDEKAEIMSLAKKLQDPKMRSDLVNLSLSKRSFFDYSCMPEWFIEYEKEYNKFNLPITKEEVIEMKQQLKAINSRASHRVAEAKARRKKRMVMHMKKEKDKILKSMENDERFTGKSMRELETIYKKTKKKFKPIKIYNICRNNGNTQRRKLHGKSAGVTYTRMVDRRLKKDKRSKNLKK